MRYKHNFYTQNLIIGIFFSLIALHSCKEDNSRCKNFRTGIFIYGNNEWTNVRIHREKNSQIEILGDTLQAYFTIKWTGDCSYDLIGEKVVYNSETKPLDVKPLHVTITEIINDSTYRYTSIGGEEGSSEGIIIKTAASAK